MGMLVQQSSQTGSLVHVHSGQQLHVSGVFIVLLELAVVLENLMPILVVVVWLPAATREVSDRLVAAFSVTCILSALVPTPLGLASYFSGGWYGGAPTCTTYQVTSIWCNLSSLALLTYICVNCHFAVWHLMKDNASAQYQQCQRPVSASIYFQDQRDSSCTSTMPTSHKQIHAERSMVSQNIPSPCSLLDHVEPKPSIRSSPSSAANSPINNGENNTSVSENKDSLHTDITGSSTDYDKTVYTPQHKTLENHMHMHTTSQSSKTEYSPYQFNTSEHPTELYALATHVENNNESDAHCSPSLMTTPEVAQDATLIENKRCDNGFQKQDNAKPKSSRPSPIKNCTINSSIDVIHQSTRDDSHPQKCEYCQDAEVCAPSSNQACSGTINEMKHSHVTSPVIADRLGNDTNHSQCRIYAANAEKTSSTTRDGCLCRPTYRPRHFVSVILLILFVCTFVISSLPVVGFGPGTIHTGNSCRSWLVPIPPSTRERTFFVVYLFFVYTCLLLGCSSGISVCLKVSKRMKQERKCKSRLYHEEENVPDVVELFVLDDMKRHYSLTCVVMAGLLTWLPIVTMLTLQKAGVQVSEATIMYSNIATSLPGLLNPLLYSLALARYRTGYKIIMEKCCCKVRTQKSQQLREDPGVGTDTGLTTTSGGHTCLHGRANPNFDSHMDVSVDETDDDSDEDYFPDNSDLIEDVRKQQATKLGEKTPLQALPASALSNNSRPSWQRQQDAFASSCSDTELLIPSKSAFVDEETGL